MAFSAMSTFWQLNASPNYITISPSVSNVTNTYEKYTYTNTGQGKTYAIIVVTKGTVTVTPINRSLSFGYLAVGPGAGGSGTGGGQAGGVNIGDLAYYLTATPAVPAVLTVAQPGSNTTIVATTTITSVYASRTGVYNNNPTQAYGAAGNSSAGGDGLNLSTYRLSDINLPSGTNSYIAGGGGGSVYFNNLYMGFSGGVGGGGGGYNGGGGSTGGITFGNSNTFGFNGTPGGSFVGAGYGGYNTGSGGGARGSSVNTTSGGAGVILIYYLM